VLFVCHCHEYKPIVCIFMRMTVNLENLAVYCCTSVQEEWRGVGEVVAKVLRNFLVDATPQNP